MIPLSDWLDFYRSGLAGFMAWSVRSAAGYWLRSLFHDQVVFRADEVAMLREFEYRYKGQNTEEINMAMLSCYRRAKADGDREVMRVCRGAMAYAVLSGVYAERPEKIRIED